MIYDKVDALKSLKPNKDFAWDGTDYSGLTYYGGDTVPTESEIDAEVTRLTNAEPMRLLRLERNTRLTACDWTQSRDLTLSNDADWKTYRQALRDITKTYKTLDTVKWPTEPTS